MMMVAMELQDRVSPVAIVSSRNFPKCWDLRLLLATKVQRIPSKETSHTSRSMSAYKKKLCKMKRWDYITIYDLVERIFCQILPWKWMPHSRFFRHILLVNWLVNIFRKTISHSSAHFASIQCNKLDTSVNFLCKNSKNVIHDDNLYALLTIRTSEINKVNCAEAVGGIIIIREEKYYANCRSEDFSFVFVYDAIYKSDEIYNVCWEQIDDLVSQ